jgi:hypothetical protein
MQSPDFKTLPGILVFAIYLCGMLTYCFNCNGKTRLRYALLAIGTGYMGLSSFRSISLFLVAGLPILAYTARYAKVLATPGGESKYPWLRHVMAAALVLWTGWSFYTRAGESEKRAELFLPVQAVQYIKTHLDKDRMRLFTGFNTGGYAEFEGLRPFIDARAEVFLKSNNRKADILDDYFDVLAGKKHYRELIERYQLTHFLVGKSDMLFDVYLSNDPDAELLFSDNDFKVFRIKSNDAGYVPPPFLAKL